MCGIVFGIRFGVVCCVSYVVSSVLYVVLRVVVGIEVCTVVVIADMVFTVVGFGMVWWAVVWIFMN